jgi:hypothetical protein
MPVTTFPEYARSITDALNLALATGQSRRVSVQIDWRSMSRGFINGSLLFDDESELHFREFVDTTLNEPRLMYAYHYQDANKNLIFRYDNAAHRPAFEQAEHKHTATGVVVSLAPALDQIIDEALKGQ